MAGVTDRPFRRLCLEEGAAMATSELASAAALSRRGKVTRELVRRDPEAPPAPYAIQLFGKVPAEFAEAARYCAGELGADFIDLNFCCPSRKVVRSGHGAALLRDPGLCLRIAESSVKAAGVPVTVKARPGFSPEDRPEPVIFSLGPALAETGVCALTLHPRWAVQAFGGEADWSMVRRLAEISPVPVLGSGDVDSAALALRRLRESGVAAVMLGRAARGRPWLFAECLALWRGEPVPLVSRDAVRRAAARHARLLESERGPRAVYVLRSVLSWYIRDLKGAASFRKRICSAGRIDEQLEILREAFLEDPGDPEVSPEAPERLPEGASGHCAENARP
jgi:nifR3 family TIM-barrel protein